MDALKQFTDMLMLQPNLDPAFKKIMERLKAKEATHTPEPAHPEVIGELITPPENA